jgi:hypothetical protein
MGFGLVIRFIGLLQLAKVKSKAISVTGRGGL